MGKKDLCCAVGCSHVRAKGAACSFFNIPEDPKLRALWLSQISRVKKVNVNGEIVTKPWTPGKSVKLCGCHFIVPPPTKSRKKWFLVPTLFPHRTEVPEIVRGHRTEVPTVRIIRMPLNERCCTSTSLTCTSTVQNTTEEEDKYFAEPIITDYFAEPIITDQLPDVSLEESTEIMSSRSSSRRGQNDTGGASNKHSKSADDDSEEVEEEEEESSEDSEDAYVARKPAREKVNFSMPEDIKKLLERVLCCSCGKQLNPMNTGAIRRHPWLKVVTCKKCYKFLKSGPFTMDSDGIDEQCRWCGDGGRLYGCDYCNHCFCRSCIKRNMGRSEAAKMEDEGDSKWHCYMCKPKKIQHLQRDCKKILEYVEMENEKEKARLERAKQREKEKMEAHKKERELKVKMKKEERESSNEKDRSVKKERRSDRNDSPKLGLPPPRDKDRIIIPPVVKKEEKKDPDLIIIENPDKMIKDRIPHFQHHRATHYKPNRDTGVQKVVKAQGNVLQVTVGPKKPMMVSTPFSKDNSLNIAPKFPSGLIGQPNVNFNLGMGRTNLGAGNTGINLGAGNTGINMKGMLNQKPATSIMGGFDVTGFKIVAEANDISSLKRKVYPFNVESLVSKLHNCAQSFTLSLNSVKTDLAISKLTSTNQIPAQNTAASNLKNGLDTLFNTFRELFNVKIVAVPPANKPLTGITSATGTKDAKSDQSTIVLDGDGSLVIVSDDEKSGKAKVNGEVADEDIDDNDYVVEVNDNFDDDEDDTSVGDSSKDKDIDNDGKKNDGDDKEGVDNEKSEMEVDQDNGKVEKEKTESDEKEKSGGKDKSEGKLDLSENANAELELLKEISELDSDEGGEEMEEDQSEEEVKETRRSTRGSKAEGDGKDLKEKSKDSPKDKSKDSSKKLKSKKDGKEVTESADGDKDSEGSDKEEEESSATSKRRSCRKISKDEKSEKSKGESSEDKTEDNDDVSPTRSRQRDRKGKSGSGKSNKEGDKDGSGKEEKDKSPSKESKEKSIKLKSEASKEKSGKSEICKKEEKTDKDSAEDVESDTENINEKVKDNKSKSKSAKGTKSDEKVTEKEHSSDAEEDKPVKAKHSSDAGEDKPVKAKSNGKLAKSSEAVTNGVESSMDESDDTDCSENSVPEFGSRKKKRKSVSTRDRAESSSGRQTRATRQAKSGGKSDNAKPSSDQGSDYDSDLESEIMKLSKDTKLTRSRTRGATKESGKEEPTKGKKAESKNVKKETKSSAKSKNEDEGEDSDNENEENEKSGSGSDAEEEEEDVKTTRSSRRGGKAKVEESTKGKKAEEKGKKGKKSSILYESDSNDDQPPPDDDDEEEEENSDTMEELSPSQIKKLKKAQEQAAEDESDENEIAMLSDMSSDPDISFPKLSTPKKKGGGKGGKKGSKDDDVEVLSDDSDFQTPKKKKQVRSKLIDAKVSDSDSDDNSAKKKKGKGKGKGKRKAESEEATDDEEGGGKKKKGKRRRIKKLSSSDEDKEPGADDDVGSEEEDGDPDTPGGYLKRKKIRRVQGTKKLKSETKKAQKAEEERRKRIEDRQKEYNAYVEVEAGDDEEDIPEGTERSKVDAPVTDSISKILGSPKKVPVTTKCVLEMDKEKKKTLIEIDRTLVRKLKPHQVEAVRFMFNCCVESVERIKKEEVGAGCIVAHCMGLGKTLSVISFVHTMLSNVKRTKMEKCLVVCPLNTCLNWVNEFEIWLADIDFEIEVYEMSKVKQNFERAQMLKEWHEGGAAVLILGYDMYRNLVMGSHCRNKKQKKIFYECLADPGPDIVVCDEGHILKNDQTSLSKSMSKIKTRRRIVLTGTPLQNNLTEYHCMVDFVKPSLLGTRKEFGNRFANPITNGQCKDSTSFDVKLMKRRAHILHELLAGCVQRKDYSALTKFLPPKFEYVISVRMSKVQVQLYEKYLELSGMNGEDIQSKGARLFKDYQALMRIWTHPWVLKLDEIRQENKRPYDDEDDSFVDDESSGEDSFISDKSTPSSSSAESEDDKLPKKRRTRGRKGSSSSDSDERKKKEDKDEVVKKWTSRRRGNEEGAGSSWMEEMGYQSGPKELSSEWWAEFVKEEDESKLELSGKLMLLFEILKMCEDIGDKVLLFSQSLLSLDIIEDFLDMIDDAMCNKEPDPAAAGDGTSNADNEKAGGSGSSSGAGGSGSSSKDKAGGSGDKPGDEEKKKLIRESLSKYATSWTKGADYFRMDGSTSSIHRKSAQDYFNDPENYRARLFLISTKAGSLGINLVGANRVIIFDASWNPSHDIQSIFRVYRFGQIKPVYVYRFLAQGTMEEKIYERQVTKQSLSQRVVDEHQIERHFTSSDLQELYKFTPDRLDDPDRKEQPLPVLPKDHMLAEMTTTNKDWIVTFHEHDSLLENIVEQELSEEEKKAAWEDYENEKKGLINNVQQRFGGAYMNPAIQATQQMNMQNLLLQGQNTLGQAAVLQIIQDLKARFPNTQPEVFQQRVQAVLRQVLTQQIMQQSEIQRRQIEQQKMTEIHRLNHIKQQIARQQAMLNSQQQGVSMFNAGISGASNFTAGSSSSQLSMLAANNSASLQDQQRMPLLRQAMQTPNILKKK